MTALIRRFTFTMVVTTVAACSSGSTTSSIPVSSAPAPATSTVPPLPPLFGFASATLRDLAGGRVGAAQLADSYAGVIITATVTGLGLGGHAIHIHEVGKCESPFTSAGDHFNPERRRHGFKNRQGHHLGDMPNIDMPAAGTLKFEFVLPGVTIEGPKGLLSGDGTSIVIHSSKDDLTTDPAGEAGGRQACGVIRRS
jgi:superoxide dismutase, Cu-Zn family